MSLALKSNTLPVFPEVLETHLKEIFKEDFDAYKESFLEPEIGSFRVNSKKCKTSTQEITPIKWSNQGFNSKLRPAYAYDPFYHAGVYYSQEPASMFLEHVLNYLKQTEDVFLVLDMCAAPGGKSIILSDVLSEALIVSNETIAKRAQILKENILKWGNQNVVIIYNDPSVIAKSGIKFDLILVDAPCSGEGLFRKDRDSIKEWSIDNVKLCSSRQKRILAEANECLKVGGILIYSTCTYNTLENEGNCVFMTEEFQYKSISIPFDQSMNIQKSKYDNIIAYRFSPNATSSEGLFLAVFRKENTSVQNMEHEINKTLKPKNNYLIESNESSKKIPDWITYKSEDFNLYSTETNYFYLIQKKFADQIIELTSFFHIVLIPGKIGEVKRDDFIPAQELCLNAEIKLSINTVELSLECALQFLARTQFKLSNLDIGLFAATYKGKILGFGKIISPSRWNNYYPDEWRIKAFTKMTKLDWRLSDYVY